MDIKGNPPRNKKNHSRFNDIRPAVPQKPTPTPPLTVKLPAENPKIEVNGTKKLRKTDPKTVEINISLPKLKLPSWDRMVAGAKRLYERTPKKKTAIIAGGLVGLVILYFAAMTLLHQFSLFVDSREGDFDSAKVIEKPNFTTILPNGRPIEQFGGWKRVSPPKSDPVFAYVDKIGNIAIQISQQKIPEEFKPNIDESVEQLAHDFGAKEKFTAGGLTLHVGQTFKGQQSVIFSKNDTMVLMRSESKITNNAWGKYALSLK